MSSRSSKTDPTASLPDRIDVARIRRPHGVRGEVLVESLSDVPGRFDAGSRLYLVGAGGEARVVEVASSRPHAGGLLLSFRGLDDRDAVAPYRGGKLEVERRDTPEAPAGSFYYFELVGCRCVDSKEGELGEVEDVVEDGGGLLLRVRGEERELLIPFVERYLVRVDVAGRLIALALPAGLADVCASRS
jgi:16S rRNA processing protein RimM